jgi:hypothetical protein
MLVLLLYLRQLFYIGNKEKDIHARALNYQCRVIRRDQVISVPTIIDFTIVLHAMGVLSLLLAIPKRLQNVMRVLFIPQS